MALDVGELVARLTLDRSGFDRGLNESQSRFSRAASGLATVATGVGLAVGGAVGAAGVIGVKTAAQMETARIGFTTMLGSAQKADSFLRDLQKFAASTPFEFPELQTAASSLISAGVEAKNVIPIMTSLGNATSGMGTGSEGVQRATVALQQMNAAGKISAEDLNQLRDAGIPVYDLLASAMGKPKEEVAQLAANGKLGKQALDQMMSALESGKGLERFSGLMDKQSASLAGLWSTLKDTVSMGLAQAITPLLPVIKDGLGWLATHLPGIINAGLSFGRTLHEQVWPVLKDLGSEVRDRLAPILARVFAFVTDQGIPAFQRVAEFVRANFMPAMRSIGEFITNTLVPAFRSVSSFLVTTFTPTFHALVNFYTQSLAPALRGLFDRIQANLPALQDLGKFIATVVVVVAALAAKIVGVVMPVLLKLAGFLIGNLVGGIGVVIDIIGGLVRGFEGLWHAAQDAWKFIGEAFTSIQNAASFMWDNVLRPTFAFIANAFLTVVGTIIDGAARAFGWVPGIGGKLKDAAAHFDTFRDDVNASLSGLKDKTINVTAITGTSGNVQAGNAGAAFHAAGGAISGPGSGTSDSIPAMLSNGEHVWTAAEVQKAGGHQAVYAMRAAVRRYATGGEVSVNAQANAAPITSGLSSWYGGVVDSVTAAGRKQAAAQAAAYSGPMPTGDAVTRWAPLVASVLAELGLDGGLVPKVLRQIKTESGGNPNATQGNIGDVNNRTGDLARGLMQVIGATFRAYAGPYLRLGQYDPHASIYAGLNYARHRYGPNLSALGNGHGYDSGGMAVGTGLMAKGTIAPERVLSPRQTESFERLVQVLEQGGVAARSGVSVDMGGVTLVNSQATPEELARALHWQLSS